MKKYHLLLIIFILVTLSYLPESSSLSCRGPEAKLIALCQENTCTRGFIVNYISTGNLCDTRPIVIEEPGNEVYSVNIGEIISVVKTESSQEVLSGIYELEVSLYCFRYSDYSYFQEFCHPSLKKLSDSTEDKIFNQYLQEWKAKEQEGLRAVAMSKFWRLLIIIVITLLAIIWPWVIMKVWPSASKYKIRWLILAILTQIFAALILLLYGLSWSYFIITSIANKLLLLIALSIVIEIIYIIYKKIKPK